MEQRDGDDYHSGREVIIDKPQWNIYWVTSIIVEAGQNIRQTFFILYNELNKSPPSEKLPVSYLELFGQHDGTANKKQ